LKRILILMLVMGLIFGSIATADAKKKKKKKRPAPRIERTVEFEYQCPCVGLFQLGSATGGDPNLGGGPISVGADDLYLTAEAVDATGGAVPVDINQDDGTGANASTGSFCTTTEEPIALVPGMEIRVFIGDPTICPGAAVSGTITFTLSNMP